jgi:hypothetical protein
MDTRGYVVRDARVNMPSAPVRALMPAKARLSADDGSAVFAVRPRRTTRRRTTVTLPIRAIDPAAPARQGVEPSSPRNPDALLMPLDRVILGEPAQVFAHVRPMPDQRRNS